MNARVSIVKCQDYTPSNVLRAVKEAVDLIGGIERFVAPGQKVLIKPNLLSPKPPQAARQARRGRRSANDSKRLAV